MRAPPTDPHDGLDIFTRAAGGAEPVLRDLLTLLRLCPLAHQTWLSMLSSGLSLHRLGPATYALSAVSPERDRERELQVLLVGLPSAGDSAHAAIEYKSGESIRIALTPVADVDAMDRVCLSWSALLAALVALADPQRGLLSPGERAIVTDFVAATHVRLRAASDGAGGRVVPESHTLEASSKEGVVPGAVAAMLAAVFSALVADLLARAVDADALRGHPAYVALIALTAALPAVLVLLLARRRWGNRWLAAVAAALVTLDVAWPFRRWGESAVVAGGAASAVAVTTVLILATAAGPDPLRLEGRWRVGRFEVVSKTGYSPGASWPAERWRLTLAGCGDEGCSYHVTSNDGSAFVLRPIGDTWVGRWWAQSWCVQIDPPYRVVTRNGYRDRETVRLVPTGDAQRAVVELSIAGTATRAAHMRGCRRATSAELSSAARRE